MESLPLLVVVTNQLLDLRVGLAVVFQADGYAVARVVLPPFLSGTMTA